MRPDSLIRQCYGDCGGDQKEEFRAVVLLFRVSREGGVLEAKMARKGGSLRTFSNRGRWGGRVGPNEGGLPTAGNRCQSRWWGFVGRYWLLCVERPGVGGRISWIKAIR